MITQPNNQIISPATQTPLQTQSTPTQPNTPSFYVGSLFIAEFGSKEEMKQLRDLENQRSLLFWPQFEQIYSKIQCSTLTQYLLFHCQGIYFEKKEDIFKWCQEELKVEIIPKGLAISMM